MLVGRRLGDRTTATATTARHDVTATRSATVTGQLPSANALFAVVDQWRQRVQAPGAIVAVRLGTGSSTIVVSGADAKTGAPLDPHVPFAIASITKTFVSALVLDLVDEGKVALDDPLAEYVPTFPNAERITLRELLTHTSGIPPEGNDSGTSIYSDAFNNLVLSNLDRTFTNDDILDFVRDRPLLFDPGTGVQYSNVNTILLGKVVENVTGTSLTTALRQRLIAPLDLTHTYYGATEDGEEATPGVFTLVDGGPLVNTADFPSRGLLSALGAAGGMISNVDDLLTWSEKFLRAGALDDTNLSESRFAVNEHGLGLGVVVFDPDLGGCVFAGGCATGAPLVGVMGSGSLPGTNSAAAYFPRWDLTIVAMATSNLVDVDHELVGLLLNEIVGDAKGS